MLALTMPLQAQVLTVDKEVVNASLVTAGTSIDEAAVEWFERHDLRQSAEIPFGLIDPDAVALAQLVVDRHVAYAPPTNRL